MYNPFKRIVGAIIAIVLVIAMVPAQALAAYEDDISAQFDSSNIILSNGNDEGIVTRIAWIHELASRFSDKLGDYDITEVEFSDYNQSEEYYQDAVWAWNMGILPENDDFSIDPFAPATYEFSADTLCSCLDLRLNEESTGYAVVASLEEGDTETVESNTDTMLIAERRGWFDENAVPAANVTQEDASIMLCDAEKIVSLAEVQENYDSTYTYADGVIEVPKEIGFAISSDETAVTIYSDELSIEAGDDFVVYMDSLPIAYRALEVAVEPGSTTIVVEKAIPTVYEYVDTQGAIALTAENAEFIPADGVMLLSDGFDFSNGKLSLSTSLGDSKAEVYLDNLRLNHSFSNDSVTVSVSGEWGLTSTLTSKEEIGPEVPLGKIRILGVGVIGVSLKLSIGAEMSVNVSGTFSAGVSSMSDGTTRGIHSFSVNNNSLTAKASLSASIKINAGVDVVIAQAIVYAEIGAETQYTHQSKENASGEIVHCQDFRYYFFLTVGAELNYFAFWKGSMSTLASADYPIMDDTKGPCVLQCHWEDGKQVSKCTMGMTVVDQSNLYSGGSTTNIGTSLAAENMERALESTVSLPSDFTVDDDYTINQKAVLETNGYAFTVNGDLIINGGTLTVNGGTLNVNGDLIINKGTVTVNSSGVINLKGNLKQLSASGGNFACYGKIVLCGADSQQSFYFESPSVGVFSSIDLNGHHLIVTGNMQTSGNVDMDMHNMTVSGDLTMTNGTMDINGGTLTVSGDVHQSYGTMYIHGGTLDIGGDYAIAGSYTKNPDGSTTYTYSSSSYTNILKMDFASDVVQVGGNFGIYTYSAHNGQCTLTAGTMYIAGDFTQRSYNNYSNFNASGSHTVVLNGSDTQHIYFEDYSYSKFNILQLTQPTDQYIFSPDPCWNTLYEQGNDVVVGVSSIGLSNRNLSLTAGSTHQLSAVVYPNNATDKTLVWSSSNESVATVDQTGRITAVASGTADIRVTASNGLYRTCTVKVSEIYFGELTVGSVNASPGTSVYVPITILDNPGIVSMSLEVIYDESVLTLTGVEDTGLLSGAMHTTKYSSPYSLTWENDTLSENIVATGNIVYLVFTVSETAEYGTYTIQVNTPVDGIYNYEGDDVDFAMIAGTVTVRDYIIGDVNGDGVVTNKDRLLLARYLAKWEGYDLSMIDQNAADINGDGAITNKDRLYLARHLAKWEGYETLPIQ